jgi:hypothetical protein
VVRSAALQRRIFTDDLLKRHKPGTSAAVIIPVKKCAATIEGIVRRTVDPSSINA